MRGIEEVEGRGKEEPGKGMPKYWGGDLGGVHNHLSSKKCGFSSIFQTLYKI